MSGAVAIHNGAKDSGELPLSPRPPFSSQSVNNSTPTLATRDSQDHNFGDKSMSTSSSACDTPNMSNPALAAANKGSDVALSPRHDPHQHQQHASTASNELSDVESGGPRGGPPSDDDAEKNFKPKTAKFWLIMLSNFVAMFLVALDRTIIATAIPRITDEFGSLGDIGWYGSAYMLTTAASQLLFGRIYKFYNLRWFVTCFRNSFFMSPCRHCTDIKCDVGSFWGVS
jgi:hypothetical protein